MDPVLEMHWEFQHRLGQVAYLSLMVLVDIDDCVAHLGVTPTIPLVSTSLGTDIGSPAVRLVWPSTSVYSKVLGAYNQAIDVLVSQT